jgi:hypothetical protein
VPVVVEAGAGVFAGGVAGGFVEAAGGFPGVLASRLLAAGALATVGGRGSDDGGGGGGGGFFASSRFL